MKLLLTLLTLLSYGAAELCVIKTAKDLDAANSCNLLILDGDNSVMQSPQLFEKIKMASTYEHFKLADTKLDYFSGVETVVLPRGATLQITDNAHLRKMPKFHIVDGTDIKITVLGNPKLDTNQLLHECRAKGCSEETMSTIQMPYTCRPTSPVPHGCRALFGEVHLENYDESFDEVEVIYGTVSLINSEFDRAPKLAKLAAVEQIGKQPVLIIENNRKLQKVDTLLNVNYKIKHNENAVVIERNPKLCVDSEIAANTLVLEQSKEINLCSGVPLLHQGKRKRVIRDTETKTKVSENEADTKEGDDNLKNDTIMNSVAPGLDELGGLGNDTTGAGGKSDEDGITGSDASNTGNGTFAGGSALQNAGGNPPSNKDSDTSLGSSLLPNSCWIIALIYALSLYLKNS